MEISNADFIGYIGSFLLSILYFPQLRRVLVEKSTESLSLSFLVLACLVSVCFLIYGMMIERLPIIISNSIALIINLICLGYYVIDKPQNDPIMTISA